MSLLYDGGGDPPRDRRGTTTSRLTDVRTFNEKTRTTRRRKTPRHTVDPRPVWRYVPKDSGMITPCSDVTTKVKRMARDLVGGGGVCMGREHRDKNCEEHPEMYVLQKYERILL